MTKEEVIEAREAIEETRRTMDSLKDSFLVPDATSEDKDNCIILLMGVILTLCEIHSLSLDEEEERND